MDQESFRSFCAYARWLSWIDENDRAAHADCYLKRIISAHLVQTCTNKFSLSKKSGDIQRLSIKLLAEAPPTRVYCDAKKAATARICSVSSCFAAEVISEAGERSPARKRSN